MNADDYLAPFPPIERVTKLRLSDARAQAFAGETVHGLYRAIESGALRCERAPAPQRKDGRRGASRIFVTLRDIAEWRASRSTSINETTDAPVVALEAARARRGA